MFTYNLLVLARKILFDIVFIQIVEFLYELCNKTGVPF